MPTLYPYIRVSTVEQADNFSPAAQLASYRRDRELIARTCNLHYEAAEPTEDLGHSAFKKMIFKREKFRELIRQLKPGDGLYFAYLDRACRNLRDILNLEHWAARHDITIHYGNIQHTTDRAQRLTMLTMSGLLAELESIQKSRRGKEVHAEKRAQGISAVCSKSPQPLYARTGKKGQRYNKIDHAEMADIAWIVPQLEGAADPATRERLRELGYKTSKGPSLSLEEARIALEDRFCKRVGMPLLLNYTRADVPAGVSAFHPWHWVSRTRVKHAYAMFRALTEAGADNEKIWAAQTMGREKLMATYPIRVAASV